jgi:hypothetical protein
MTVMGFPSYKFVVKRECGGPLVCTQGIVPCLFTPCLPHAGRRRNRDLSGPIIKKCLLALKPLRTFFLWLIKLVHYSSESRLAMSTGLIHVLGVKSNYGEWLLILLFFGRALRKCVTDRA